MTDIQKTASTPTEADVPEWGAVRRALRNLQDYATNPAAADFPMEALDMMERYLDAATPSLVISAKLSQLKFSMHSLKSIANGVHEPSKLAALAIKHILGPLTTVDESVGPAPQQLPFAITDDELTALHRFHECAADGEGYDVPAEMMRRLAELGLVNRKSGAYFETTAFGMAVVDGAFAVTSALHPEPTPAEDPAVYDQWVHERLFANPPLPVTPFDAWQAGRQEERRVQAVRKTASPAPTVDQRALFDAWCKRDGDLPVSRKGAFLKIWRVALESQPGAGVPPYSLTPAEMAMFEAWCATDPQMSRDADGYFAVWLAALAAVAAQPVA